MPSELECDVPAVPSHLHRRSRPVDENFEDGEKLFRRHQLPERRIKAIITFDGMSVNRSKYCKGPEDALVNVETGDLYSGYGVVSFAVSDVAQLLETVSTPPDIAGGYSCRVKHTPLGSMPLSNN